MALAKGLRHVEMGPVARRLGRGHAAVDGPGLTA